MMKIAYMMGSLNRGGTETLVLDSFRNINETGIDVCCVYRMDGLLSKDFINTGVMMLKLKPRHLFDIIYIFKLRRILHREKIMIVHAQQPIDALFAYIASRGLKTHVMLTIHGYDFKYSKLAKFILKFVHKRLDLNVFVSHAQKDYFVPKYGFTKNKTSVLYNGISFDKFNEFQHFPLRKEFNIPDHHFLLGSVGNFNPARDQLTICRFLNLLNKEDIPFSFVFAGARTKAAPWYFDKCYEYCRTHQLLSKVFFPGSRNDVANILDQLDAFIYSTAHDTFGIAVIEAIYMGLPVFVNDWDVITEVTGNGEHAIIYKSKNEHDLLEKFLNFTTNPGLFKNKALKDSEWVKVTYSIQNHLKNLKSTYEAII